MVAHLQQNSANEFLYAKIMSFRCLANAFLSLTKVFRIQ